MKNSKSEIEKYTRDNKGNLFSLDISPLFENVSVEDFIPDVPNFPNACRYMIVAHKIQMIQGVEFEEAHLINDIELKEAIIKRLKELHGITDPWDKEPELYAEKWRKAHEARPKLKAEELERIHREAQAEALEEERMRQRKAKKKG